MAPQRHNRSVLDFGDAIPIVDQDPIWGLYGESLAAINKCLIIRMAAAFFRSMCSADTPLEESALPISKLARQLRLDQYRQAVERGAQPGEPPPNDPLFSLS